MPSTGRGRTVVVTGANEGIGNHLLRSLVGRGYRVVGLDIEGAHLKPLAADLPDRVRYVECDVTKTEDVEQAIETVLSDWGHLDILVNNAAVFSFAPFQDQTIAATKREFEVNYFGTLRLLHAVLPHMRKRHAGIVHTMSSGAGLVGHPGLTGYASTKGAIESLVRSLRLEFRHEGVTCTVMHPPLTNTASARRLGYPASVLSDPADVGENLAEKIESTDRVIFADWKTKLGLALSRRFPRLVEKGTDRFVSRPG